MKACNKCKKEFPLDKFAKQGKRGLRAVCKSCWAAYMRNYNAKNSEKIRENQRLWKLNNHDTYKSSQLKHNFGISLEEYKEMLLAQDFGCAICGKTETIIDPRTGTPRMLAVDHCHETGKVRGLLCFACNSAIGSARHSTEILEEMINYLDKQTEKEVCYG